MRIAIVRLYVTEDSSGQYYQLQEVGLAKAFVRSSKDIKVDILFLSRQVKKMQVEKLEEGICVYLLPTISIGHHGYLDCRIFEKLKTNLVHLQADNMLYAPSVIRYCMKHDIACHLYLGTLMTDSPSVWKQRLNRLYMKRNLKWYKKIPAYVKTPYVQKQCRNEGIKNPILAPVGLDVDGDGDSKEKTKSEIRFYLELPSDKRLILFIGRLEEYKHPHDAVRLIKDLPDSYHLIVIGDGSLKNELEDVIHKERLEDRITLRGKVPHQKIYDFERACDLLINLNPKEIYGMAILEAMSQGCPVAAIHAPGPDYILDDGKAGRLFDDVDQLKKFILEWDEDLLERISCAATERIENSFVWDCTAEIILSGKNH